MAALFGLSVALVTSAPAGAQLPPELVEKPPVADGDPGAEEEPAKEQPVEVEDAPADARIAARLQGILVSAEWFQQPTVRADNGVVFLSGITPDEEHKEWARKLALRTEGVVAVVNRIEVREPPWWNLGPALVELDQLARDAASALPLVLIGLGLFLLILLLARHFARLVTRLSAARMQSKILASVIEKGVFFFTVLVGLYVFLRVAGLTQIAVTLLGSTGLIGLMLGFAFRDIAENFLAGILISLQRPFRIGDLIEVEGHLGVVQKVTTRGTLLMDFDGNHIQLLNSTVYKSCIRNFTANPKSRLSFAVGVGYDASLEEAQLIALAACAAHRAVLADPAPSVLVEELKSSTVALRVFFWVDGEAFSRLKVLSAVMRRVVRALLDAGVSLPDDAREVVFPGGVPVQMLGEGQSASGRAPARSVEGGAPPVSAEESDGEGTLAPEEEDLQRQAAAARQPDEGADILADTRP